MLGKREEKAGILSGSGYPQEISESFKSRSVGTRATNSFNDTGYLNSGILTPLTRSDIARITGNVTRRHSALPLGVDVRSRPAHLADLVEHLIPEMMRTIEASRNILDIRDDWDGEGSVGYAEATWNRATEFLKRNAFTLKIHHDKELVVPRILPGPEGSIDLHWKIDTHELLINIPVDPDEPADFYGDSGPNHRIKGKLRTSAQNEWILMWLMS